MPTTKLRKIIENCFGGMWVEKGKKTQQRKTAKTTQQHNTKMHNSATQKRTTAQHKAFATTSISASFCEKLFFSFFVLF